MKTLPLKTVAFVLVSTAIILGAAFVLALPFNFIL